jgi:hypothetical protein
VVPGDRQAVKPYDAQAHREREQAQGTLGTAAHSTRAPETGQSRVPMLWDTQAAARLAGLVRPVAHRRTVAPGGCPDGTRRGRGTGRCSAVGGGKTSDRPPTVDPRPRPSDPEASVHPDSARELKARVLELLAAAPPVVQASGYEEERRPHVAVGLAPDGGGRARVAVRLQAEADRALIPDLGRAAAEQLDVRVIGRVRALSSPAPGDLQQRVRPLRPGLSVAHPGVTAGTLGGFVRLPGGLAVLSNNHVLAATDAASPGDAILQPGPADGGDRDDRIATLTAFERFAPVRANLVDAAVALLDRGVEAQPGDVPGGPLTGCVPASLDIDPDERVEKVGRTTGHTRGRITAVEVDGVAVQYDEGVYSFDDQIEISGTGEAFSDGGDSGSVIWRSRDRAPLCLLFAGSSTGGEDGTGVTFANPLATVLAAFGAEWVSG